MKTLKLSFDFSDNPKLVELLRMNAAKTGKTQKAILVDALNYYLSNQQEEEFILSAANKSFDEWSNPEDEVYDTL
jgi:hypothetical protein